MVEVVAFVTYLLAVWIILVNIMFAFGVRNAARVDESRGNDLQFVGTFGWFLATLLGGPFTAGLYWAMHRSTLRPSPASPEGNAAWR